MIWIQYENEKIVTNSGNISIERKTDSFTCAVSGLGYIKVYASNSIEAHSSGSGHIYYKGNPQNEKVKSSGSGSVRGKN